MRIGEVAAAAGVPTKTIRFYEDIGLLPPAEREANGYRAYDADIVDRLRFIKDAQATGLTLDEIGAVQEMRTREASTCEHVTGLMERHLARLDDHIRELQATRDTLSGMIERAHRVDPTDCTDPHRCQTIEATEPVTRTARPVHLEAM